MKFLKKLFSQNKEEELKSEVLLEERSPTCPITAIVEQDQKVAYFYLWGDEHTLFSTKACWIRNIQPAPQKAESKPNGRAPMMTKQYCKYPLGQNPLEKEQLSIIWTEEGDGAALFIGDEIAAIIPSWSGNGGFNGYARDCIGQGEFAWELGNENVFPQRIAKAKEYWDSWDQELNPFYVNQPILLESYDEALGESDKYYAIDGNEWPPKGLFLRKGEEKVVFATVGVSLLPQPEVEIYYEFPNQKNRIELGLILNNTFTDLQCDEISKWISGASYIPWENITHLGEGHTTNIQIPGNEVFKAVLLTNQLDFLPKVELNPYRGSTINLLWMIPISDSERNFIIENGSKEFLNEMNEIGEEIYSLERTPLR